MTEEQKNMLAEFGFRAAIATVIILGIVYAIEYWEKLGLIK